MRSLSCLLKPGTVLPAAIVCACAAALPAQQQPRSPETPPAEGASNPAGAQQRPADRQPQSNPRPDARPGARGARTPPPADQGDHGDQRPILGVMLEPSETTGVLVTAVMPEGPADQAGLREGDYILAVDDQRINSADELSDRISRKRLGDEIQLTVWRDGARQQLQAALSPLPEMQHNGARREQTNSPAGESTPWIGAWLGKAPEGDGVAVRGVYPSGPAARAGLYSGDTIVSIRDRSVTTPEEAIAAVRELAVNEPAEFKIRRDDEELTVTVQPDRRDTYDGGTVYPPTGDDDWADFDDRMEVPEHAMMLEQHRRLAEQHERIEQMIEELRDEVRQLRSELQQGRAN